MTLTSRPPVFIIGAGRSGSTVFHRVIAMHSRTAWLSPLCDQFPSRPIFNRRLMQALSVPGLSSLLSKRFEPEECYRFWDHRYQGFSVPCRDLMADDVTEGARKGIASSLDSMKTRARDQLLLKITGWPRVGFLRDIFPDARFIHVLRDGRAVASSLLKVDWWGGWRGPENWRWGPLTPEFSDLWHETGKSFVALAGLQWRILVESAHQALASLPPEDLLELRYEDFCSDPEAHCRRALEFSGLAWTDSFERALKGTAIKSENERWGREFTTVQQQHLTMVIRPTMERLGYSL